MSKKITIEFTLNRETKIPKMWRDSIPSSGSADDAVEYIRTLYNVEVNGIELIKYLKSTGGWNSDELLDHDANIDRLIWLSTLDCKENKSNHWYMGE